MYVRFGSALTFLSYHSRYSKRSGWTWQGPDQTKFPTLLLPFSWRGVRMTSAEVSPTHLLARGTLFGGALSPDREASISTYGLASRYNFYISRAHLCLLTLRDTHLAAPTHHHQPVRPTRRCPLASRPHHVHGLDYVTAWHGMNEYPVSCSRPSSHVCVLGTAVSLPAPRRQTDGLDAFHQACRALGGRVLQGDEVGA